MLFPKPQKDGSAVCYACNKLVSVKSETCMHCGSRNPGLWGYARTIRRWASDSGFIRIVTWGCIGLYLVTLSGGFTIQGGLDLLSPRCRGTFLAGATGSIPVVLYGRWWTVLSAGWLHGGLIHLGFNLVWIRHMAPSVAKAYGAARLNIIYTLSIITGALLTSLVFILIPSQGAPLAVGASGGIFGLFGALAAYGHRTQDYSIGRSATIYALIGFIMGLVIPGIDNWGHLGGFAGGYLITQIPWLDARKPQRVHDVFISISCFALAVLSVLTSMLHTLWLWYTGVGLPPGCI